MAEETKTKQFDKQKLLLSLQQKHNKCRVELKKHVENEKREEAEGPLGTRKREKEEEKKKKEEFVEELKSQGIDPERYQRLHQTQETLDSEHKTKKRKLNNALNDVDGDAAVYRSFKKRRENVAFSKEDYERQKQELGDSFYQPGSENLEYGKGEKDKEERLKAMVTELSEQEKRREKFSRRRTWVEDADIDFINESNRKYNQKIKRAFDKYTVEIRENLERGTAL
eukprot:TRINITY_DN5000_c0_g1_i1.p1 TRINITY_DN5000_c0_g1~~TRINITY_DN5000_c0_g1_i1.p1  ORF type:complete len:226 (+),score=72.30 TRINITY_DN5000_c0_g1_i1:471-1148(+)